MQIEASLRPLCPSWGFKQMILCYRLGKSGKFDQTILYPGSRLSWSFDVLAQNLSRMAIKHISLKLASDWFTNGTLKCWKNEYTQIEYKKIHPRSTPVATHYVLTGRSLEISLNDGFKLLWYETRGYVSRVFLQPMNFKTVNQSIWIPKDPLLK